MKLKGQFYKTLARPTMMYRSECYGRDKETTGKRDEDVEADGRREQVGQGKE